RRYLPLQEPGQEITIDGEEKRKPGFLRETGFSVYAEGQTRLLLRGRDSVFGCFGDAELEHLLRRDFDGFAGLGVTTLTGFTRLYYKLAHAGDGETNGCLVVGQV